MDSITQATLGAAIGEALLGKRIGNKGALLGAIVATIPDFDILFLPLFDQVERISIHRGFSHSIVFCLLAAFIFTWLMSRWKWTKAIDTKRLWIFNFLVLFTHVMLDAFTTYGTQLFLPFSDYRVSFDSVNIVDPFYTLTLLAGLIVTMIHLRKQKVTAFRANRIGLIISSAYLLLTLVNKQYVEHKFQSALDSQGIMVESLLTVPVKVGNVNWFGVAKENGTLYLGKYSELNPEPITFDSFPMNEELLTTLDPDLVERLTWFAQGYYVAAESEGKIRVYNMQCDMQGVRHFGNYLAPTAFYYEISPHLDGSYDLDVGMHEKE
ncbi:MAG: metal-dependent hydrolase [Flavobacteriales bacterium]|nr:metal-dependent hydrolase [Flavobacteriales bacterium]